MPGLKLGELAESAAENNPLSPVAGKQIGCDDVSTAAVLPSATRRTADSKVQSIALLEL